jgi:hypothetical protein
MAILLALVAQVIHLAHRLHKVIMAAHLKLAVRLLLQAAAVAQQRLEIAVLHQAMAAQERHQLLLELR